MGGSQDPLFLSVKNIIDGGKLLPPGGGIISGISGGPDSVCLLHILSCYFNEMVDEASPERLAAMHVNHMLRGEESRRDEEYSASFCASLGVRFISAVEDVSAFAARRNISIEAAAREVRYCVLERERLACEAATGRAWRIAVAHNRDDLAETVLMNILRGAGVDGLHGMSVGSGALDNELSRMSAGASPESLSGGLSGMDAGAGIWGGGLYESGIGSTNCPPRHLTAYVVRPLLHTSRAEVEAYLARNNVSYVSDSSNTEAKYTRNRLRADLIPILRERYNPGITDALCRLSEIAGQDSDYLRREAERSYISCIAAGDDTPHAPHTLHLSVGDDAPGVPRHTAKSDTPDAPHLSVGDDAPGVPRQGLTNDVEEIIAPADGAVNHNPPVSLSLSRFNALHPAIATRVVRLACAGAGADIRCLKYIHISETIKLAASGRTGAVLHLPGGLRVYRSYGEIIFKLYGTLELSGQHNEMHGEPRNEPHGFVIKSLHKKDIEIVEQIRNIRYNSSEQLFDADALCTAELVLRYRQSGDIFYPINSPGEKKLKEFFIDAKLPGELRDSICLLAAGSDIAWVIGYRVSERYKVTDRTVNVLRVRYFPGQ